MDDREHSVQYFLDLIKKSHRGKFKVNKGFELEVTTQNLTGRLKWSTSLNVSYNQNKVLSLGDDNSTVFTGYDSTTQVFMVKQPLRSFYMYDAVGVC